MGVKFDMEEGTFAALSACVDDVACWMAANRLQLNHAKSEVLWC